MTCAVNKIDSNITGMSIAEEECLGVLPASPVFYALEPNTYSDFGGKPKAVSRAPIVPYRQNLAGTLVDVDASAGFNTDVTKSNLKRLMQGFFFADARENPTTTPLNGSAITISAVTGTSKTYTVASGGAAFVAGSVVNFSGFSAAVNNGIKTVASSTATTIVVNETCSDETPGAGAAAEMIGVQFASGDVTMSVTDGLATLESTTFDFTTIPNMFAGKWIYIGDDNTANTFANNAGYARVASIAAHAIVLDQASFTPVTDAGTGKTIRIYSGLAIKNEYATNLIKRRSYTIERTLGIGAYDAEQAEYVKGAIADKLDLNLKTADKLNADLTYMGTGVDFATGNTGDTVWSLSGGATVVPSAAEDAINTSSNVYEIKLSVNDPTTTTPTPLFGYVSDLKLGIDNSVSGVKAVGVFGSMDVTTGNFVVTGDVTAYFADVSAQQAIYANSSVDLYMITAYQNTGAIFDLPLLKLDGGQNTVEKDKPITMKLTANGAMNSNQHTLLYQFFSYLPNIAMAA